MERLSRSLVFVLAAEATRGEIAEVTKRCLQK
jgi:hypothetical protein